jgi:hypothetical protein
MRRAVDSALLGLSILGLAIVLSGCGGSTAATAAGGGATPGPGGGSGDWSLLVDITAGANGATVVVSPADNWPAGAPADVPAFPGHLDSVMPERSHTAYGIVARMLFSGVRKEQFAAYLDKLRNAGFQLRGAVYYSAEAGQAAAQQRAKSGDYDAVIATKDTRNLTITVPSGDGRVTFDLDGLTQAESDALDAVSVPSA